MRERVDALERKESHNSAETQLASSQAKVFAKVFEDYRMGLQALFELNRIFPSRQHKGVRKWKTLGDVEFSAHDTAQKFLTSAAESQRNRPVRRLERLVSLSLGTSVPGAHQEWKDPDQSDTEGRGLFKATQNARNVLNFIWLPVAPNEDDNDNIDMNLSGYPEPARNTDEDHPQRTLPKDRADDGNPFIAQYNIGRYNLGHLDHNVVGCIRSDSDGVTLGENRVSGGLAREKGKEIGRRSRAGDTRHGSEDIGQYEK